MTSDWTNLSVQRLAGAHDPLEYIVQRARELALDAMAAGWSGPPFDPLSLAGHLGMRVVPRDGLTDARLISDEQGFVVEYNPLRPRGRLRYSIAHEIAHALFPDAGERPRHRTSTGAVGGDGADDDWQVELLCNVAAAELLMPNFAVPFEQIDGAALDMNLLMDLRGRFDVSTEAFLRRVVAGTAHDVVCLATSRVSDAPDRASECRIDYVTRSPGASLAWERGQVVSGVSLAACSAVGYTWRASEQLDEGPVRDVQAVGIPPYPGRRMPRVMALVQPEGETLGSPCRVQHVTGDASEPSLGGRPGLIVHVVNDEARAWGRLGFTGQLIARFRRNAEAYRNWTIADATNLSLGNVHVLAADGGVTIASIVAQRGYGQSKSPRLDYGALRAGLVTVRAEARRLDAIVHMPRIGTGQGGGAWAVIEALVEEELTRQGVPVLVYSLPQERVGGSRVGAEA